MLARSCGVHCGVHTAAPRPVLPSSAAVPHTLRRRTSSFMCGSRPSMGMSESVSLMQQFPQLTFISQKLNFQPGVRPSSASRCARSPAAVAAVCSTFTASSTASRSASFFMIGTITTCTLCRALGLLAEHTRTNPKPPACSSAGRLAQARAAALV